MLRFELLASDAALDWRHTPTGPSRGRSHVEPFRHGALEEVIAVSGARLLVCVRERCAGLSGLLPGPGPASSTAVDGAEFDQLAERLRAWPLQWHMLIVEGDRAWLDAGPWGTAPVFLVAEPGVLHGDWDAARLLPRLRRESLDPVRAVRWLADYATPYSRDTLFRGLKLLTERARAEWRPRAGAPDALEIHYPTPWPRPTAERLRDGADPVDAFDSILRASLRRWTALDGSAFGCELSGGLDSGLVAAAATRGSADPVARSYGLAIAGAPEAMANQQARRAELVGAFGLDDTQIPMGAYPPLGPSSCRLAGRAPVLPWEEGYYEAMDALLEQAYADGIRVLLTGFGGDELCGLRPSELRAMGRSPPPASMEPADPSGPDFLTDAARATLSEPIDVPPRAASTDSAVEVAALSAARYMRRGIWPVHPMCTPELVRFCFRLPPEWRAGRFIERALLERYGLTRRVTHPQFRDDFSPLLASGMRNEARGVLEQLFESSVLADQGIVDGGRLRRDYAAWCERSETAGAEYYYAAAALELCLTGLG